MNLGKKQAKQTQADLDGGFLGFPGRGEETFMRSSLALQCTTLESGRQGHANTQVVIVVMIPMGTVLEHLR